MHFLPASLVGSFFLTLAAASSDETTQTCQSLAVALSDDVFYPESPTYNASIQSYPFPQLRLNPTCLVRPNSTQDVVTAINVLRDSGCTKFAVRGGGHNANTGFNDIEDGVTIDMRQLNYVEVDGDVVRVGAGAIAQDVYDVTDKYNISVMGPRIGVVGLAGFLTGGGVSFFSPELGWSCDYVENFEVVLADGTLVNANASSNSDLYVALKGGQSNFGIVTRFDLKHFPVGQLYGGRVAYAPTADVDLVEGFTQFKLAKYDPYAAGWVTNRYNATTGNYTPTSILWYTKPELKPGSLSHILDVKPQVMNGMTTANIAAFTRNASMVVKTSNFNTIWATTTFHISPTIAHKIHQKWKELIPKVTDSYKSANVASELTFQSLAPPPKSGESANSLGFSASSTPESSLVFLQIIFYYADSSATEGLNNALKDFVQIFEQLAKDEGKHNPWIYLNFAAWFQDPLAAYGHNELAQLRRVARKYDPKSLFQDQLVGGFKVFNGTTDWRGHWDQHGRPDSHRGGKWN